MHDTARCLGYPSDCPGPITLFAVGPECCVHRIASGWRLRCQWSWGRRAGRSVATPLRVATGRVTLQVGRPPGSSIVSGTLRPDSSMLALAGRACALLTVAGGATTRAQARMHRVDSDGAGLGGAGPQDSDGYGGAGSDPGPARARRHVTPRSRTRLAANVPIVPAPRSSRPP
jgi:hypothetical protein